MRSAGGALPLHSLWWCSLGGALVAFRPLCQVVKFLFRAPLVIVVLRMLHLFHHSQSSFTVRETQGGAASSRSATECPRA